MSSLSYLGSCKRWQILMNEFNIISQWQKRCTVFMLWKCEFQFVINKVQVQLMNFFETTITNEYLKFIFSWRSVAFVFPCARPDPAVTFTESGLWYVLIRATYWKKSEPFLLVWVVLWFNTNCRGRPFDAANRKWNFLDICEQKRNNAIYIQIDIFPSLILQQMNIHCK